MPSRPFQAVVFDMDGLIFDTETLYVEVGRRICARWGREFTREIQNAMAGLKGDEAIVVMLRLLGVDADPREVYDDSQRLFRQLVETQLRPMPGLMPLLDSLEAAGLRKAVATSSPRALTEDLLGRFHLQPRFELVLTAEDVVHSKPHPEMYQTMARRLGLPPRQCLVLEDSYNGMRSAVAAGAFCVAVPNFFARECDFSAADLVIDSLQSPALYELLGLPRPSGT